MSNPTLDAINARLARNDELLVEDENISKNNWRREYGKMAGFQKAWKAKFVPKNKAEPVKRGDHQMTRPAILDNKTDERVAEPDAHSLARVDGGWCVISYRINGNHCSIVGQTKPEGKQFAVSRLQEIIMKGMQ